MRKKIVARTTDRDFTVIDKTLTYASPTWTLTKRDRKELNIFESV